LNGEKRTDGKVEKVEKKKGSFKKKSGRGTRSAQKGGNGIIIPNGDGSPVKQEHESRAGRSVSTEPKAKSLQEYKIPTDEEKEQVTHCVGNWCGWERKRKTKTIKKVKGKSHWKTAVGEGKNRNQLQNGGTALGPKRAASPNRQPKPSTNPPPQFTNKIKKRMPGLM